MSWQEDMAAELSAAQNGDKALVMDRYSRMTGKSPAHLYRIAGRYGFESGRKSRSDKGECVLNDLQIKFIAGQIYTTRRERKGEIMPVKEALDIAEQNGIVEPGCISVARVQEILRDLGLNRKTLKVQGPHQSMRSLHPNHVHFMDVSVCIQYYLKNKRLRIEREDQFYKNKPENFTKIKQKIYRYVLTDHFSHTIFVKYYIARGETMANLFDFLVSAWMPKDNPEKFPFRGVPAILMMDKGAANVSKPILDFLKNMDVAFIPGLPHNPRRQGSVERAQNHVEMYFESKLRIQSVSCIDELNHFAMDWCAFMNGSIKFVHSRFNTPRTHCWLKIREEQLRECPDRKLLQDIFAAPSKECKVYGDYSIRFRGERYRIKHVDGVIPNASRVRAFFKPFSWPAIVVEFNDIEYEVRPIEVVDGGFDADAAVIGEEYKSMPESARDQQIKVIDNLAYGEDRKPGDSPFAGLHVFGGQADRIDTAFIPRTSTPMSIDTKSADERRISMFDLFRALSGISDVTPELNRAIRATYGDSISMTDRDTLVEAMSDSRLFAGSDGQLIIGGGDDTLKAAVN
ncbi:transposase family protein [uncultured Desulfobacter sp.]|uniref:transposase family protein n=1 Tax=uncultured Desulfobacter sp. TaxID=240139 RepID=UPI002AAA9E1D|nr:transposase family protein [uncultured Desulfobacter sp.]